MPLKTNSSIAQCCLHAGALPAAHHGAPDGAGDGHPGGNRSEDARNANMFGNQIRSEWQRMAARTAERSASRVHHRPAAEESQRATIQPAHHKTSENTANGYFHKFDRCTANGEDHRPHRHCHGKLQRHGRGVIHQRFAPNAHDFSGCAFANNPGERHSIGRRKHRRQRKGGISGMPGTTQ